MKGKTKRRIRLLIYPFAWVWAVIVLIIALSGAVLKALACLMIGDLAGSKEEITDVCPL